MSNMAKLNKPSFRIYFGIAKSSVNRSNLAAVSGDGMTQIIKNRGKTEYDD